MSVGPAYAVECDHDVGCITCGDLAVPMRVLEPAAGGLVRCADDDGREQHVEASLVGPLATGDVLLVHAATALQHLGRPAQTPGGAGAETARAAR